MDPRENFQSEKNSKNNHFSKNSEINELCKTLEKSKPFEYECSASGEKRSYKLSFDLIEESIQNKGDNIQQNPKQYILIIAKPFANKNNYNNKESYIHGIKKTFLYSTYKEKFNYVDFRDSSYIYSNLQEHNLINVYNDLIKSVKENKSRIKINKYHLIFNYYISDYSNWNNWNNSIMLTLDNEKEYNILECYENANQKIMYFKDKSPETINQSETTYNKNRENRSRSTSPLRSETKIHNYNRINIEQYNNNNSINNNVVNNIINNNLNNSCINNNFDYHDPNDKKKYNKNINKISSSQSRKNDNPILISKGKEINENSNNNMIQNKSSSKTNTQKSNNNNSKKKILKKSQISTQIIEKEQKRGNDQNQKQKTNKKKDKKINDKNNKNTEEKNTKPIQSPTKAEKERITKNFLYGEYNFSDFQTGDEKKNTEKKVNEEKKKEEKEGKEESEWGSSEFDEDLSEMKSVDKSKETEKENQKEKGNIMIQNKERNVTIQQIENDYNKINFSFHENKINNNNNNLLGHKIGRNNNYNNDKENRRENSNMSREKKTNDNKNKYNIERSEKIEGKSQLLNSQIITITESDEDSDNKNN